jgi:hypothetical protein
MDMLDKNKVRIGHIIQYISSKGFTVILNHYNARHASAGSHDLETVS